MDGNHFGESPDLGKSAGVEALRAEETQPFRSLYFGESPDLGQSAGVDALRAEETQPFRSLYSLV